MANRIGQFFEAMPDQQEATREVALHIARFWEPRMRRALLLHVDNACGEGLRPLVRQAVEQHRDLLQPVHG